MRVNMGIARNATEDQAPIWMKRKALQWLFRLGKKTQRMWRRYLLNKPKFVWLGLLQLLGLKRFRLP